VVQVREIPSKRWDLALEQLEVGGELTVLDGDPPIGLQRDVGHPGADGRVHVWVFTERDPKSLTQEIASREVTAGLESLAVAEAADPRLAALLALHGGARKYVFDYGYGGTHVGDIDEDGTVTLH
jgi:hypothetical protein